MESDVMRSSDHSQCFIHPQQWVVFYYGILALISGHVFQHVRLFLWPMAIMWYTSHDFKFLHKAPRAYNFSYPPLWMHYNALWVCTQCTASQPNLKLWPANFWKSEGLTSQGGGGSRCERTWASALPRTLRPSPHPRCPSTRWVVGEWKSGTLSLSQFPLLFYLALPTLVTLANPASLSGGYRMSAGVA